MTEDLKERVTDKEILLKLATLDGDEQGKYVHKIGSQRMAEHLHYLLSNKNFLSEGEIE